jgi:hypothetical protein
MLVPAESPSENWLEELREYKRFSTRRRRRNNKKEGVQKVIFGHPLFNSKNFNFKQQFSPGKFQL